VTGAPPLDIPGWYGKLPCLGDFASRRLSAEFTGRWDAWLQEVLVATRDSFGETWLDAYLTMPIWRFVLLPALIGPSGWAGVLMPSVDRVGRQFPLTLAVALPAYASVAQAVFESGDWFASLEEAALGALDVTAGPDDLERALAQRPFPPASSFLPPRGDPDSSVGVMRRLPSAEHFVTLAKAEAVGAWGQHAGWQGLWWTRGRIDASPLMLASARLPTAGEFARLLDSRLPADGSDAPRATARARG